MFESLFEQHGPLRQASGGSTHTHSIIMWLFEWAILCLLQRFTEPLDSCSNRARRLPSSQVDLSRASGAQFLMRKTKMTYHLPPRCFVGLQKVKKKDAWQTSQNNKTNFSHFQSPPVWKKIYSNIFSIGQMLLSPLTSFSLCPTGGNRTVRTVVLHVCIIDKRNGLQASFHHRQRDTATAIVFL